MISPSFHQLPVGKSSDQRRRDSQRRCADGHPCIDSSRRGVVLPLTIRMSVPWGSVYRTSPDEFSTLCEVPRGQDWRHPEKLMHISVDIKETTDGYQFFCDVPGMKKEEITLKLEGKHTLTISGGRSRVALEGADGAWHREERVMGGFVRKFRLPDKADQDGITASVQDGVLTIHVPKLTPGPHDLHEHVKKITIN